MLYFADGSEDFVFLRLKLDKNVTTATTSALELFLSVASSSLADVTSDDFEGFPFSEFSDFFRETCKAISINQCDFCISRRIVV